MFAINFCNLKFISQGTYQNYRVDGPQFEPFEHSHPKIWRTHTKSSEHADVGSPQIFHPARKRIDICLRQLQRNWHFKSPILKRLFCTTHCHQHFFSFCCFLLSTLCNQLNKLTKLYRCEILRKVKLKCSHTHQTAESGHQTVKCGKHDR